MRNVILKIVMYDIAVIRTWISHATCHSSCHSGCRENLWWYPYWLFVLLHGWSYCVEERQAVGRCCNRVDGHTRHNNGNHNV